MTESRKVAVFGAVVIVVAAWLSAAATPAFGDGCRIIMASTECDNCKNTCCESYNADMSMCRITKFLCWLVLDFECPGFTLCKMQADENLERCEMLCDADYGDC